MARNLADPKNKNCDQTSLEPFVLSSIRKSINAELIKRAAIGIAISNSVDGPLPKLGIAIGTIALHLGREKRRMNNQLKLAKNICEQQ